MTSQRPRSPRSFLSSRSSHGNKRCGKPPSLFWWEWLAFWDGGLRTEPRPDENEMMMKLLTTASSEIRKWILGFIGGSLLLCGCVTTRPYDIGQTPHQDSISDFIMRWDKLDRSKASPQEYRELYAQTLKALSRSMEETERCRSRLDQK